MSHSTRLRHFWTIPRFACPRRSSAWLCSSLVRYCHTTGRDEADSRSRDPLAASLAELQAKNKRLRAELAEMRWPRVDSFCAHGKTYSLPYKAVGTPPCDRTAEIPSGTVKYLAGFFDGDGNVHSTGSQCKLRVGQSYDHPEVLMLFLRVFGGGIYRFGRGKGLKKPTLAWVLSTSSWAAERLAAHSVTKQQQLDIAARWPNLSSAERQRCHKKLSLLKQYDSGVENSCSWEYIAGFFDAEGSIGLTGCEASVSLSVEQKFPTVLTILQRFLERKLEKDIFVARTGKAYRLQVAGGPHRRSILSSMLGAGLIRKAQQAKLALSLTNENALEIRRALHELSGNQWFARRLDEEGLNRARKIRSEAQKARHAAQSGRVDKAAAILKDIEQLKCHHTLQRALLENRLLQEYMRKMRGLDPQAACVTFSFKAEHSTVFDVSLLQENFL